MLLTLALAGNAPAVRMSGHVDAAGGTAGAAAVKTAPNVRALALTGNPVALRVLKAPATTCLGEDDRNAPAAVQEAAMECLVNYARQQAGLPRLTDSRKLDGSAATRPPTSCAATSSATRPAGATSSTGSAAAATSTAAAGGRGRTSPGAPAASEPARSVIKAWLRSPSHRANLLGSDYNQFGISLRIGGLSGSPDAHVWVNHFGRHC